MIRGTSGAQAIAALSYAPTGQAAKRITKVTGAPARTLHRMLECDGVKGRFARRRVWMPSTMQPGCQRAPRRKTMILTTSPAAEAPQTAPAAQEQAQEPAPVVDLESMTMPDKIIHIVGQKPEGMRLSAVAAAVGLGVGEDRTKLVMDLCKLVAFRKLVYFEPSGYPREGGYRLVA